MSKRLNGEIPPSANQRVKDLRSNKEKLMRDFRHDDNDLKNLVKRVKEHNNQCWENGDPQISSQEVQKLIQDRLLRALARLKVEHQTFVRDYPTENDSMNMLTKIAEHKKVAREYLKDPSILESVRLKVRDYTDLGLKAPPAVITREPPKPTIQKEEAEDSEEDQYEASEFTVPLDSTAQSRDEKQNQSDDLDSDTASSASVETTESTTASDTEDDQYEATVSEDDLYEASDLAVSDTKNTSVNLLEAFITLQLNNPRNRTIEPILDVLYEPSIPAEKAIKTIIRGIGTQQQLLTEFLSLAETQTVLKDYRNRELFREAAENLPESQKETILFAVSEALPKAPIESKSSPRAAAAQDEDPFADFDRSYELNEPAATASVSPKNSSTGPTVVTINQNGSTSSRPPTWTGSGSNPMPKSEDQQKPQRKPLAIDLVSLSNSKLIINRDEKIALQAIIHEIDNGRKTTKDAIAEVLKLVQPKTNPIRASLLVNALLKLPSIQEAAKDPQNATAFGELAMRFSPGANRDKLLKLSSPTNENSDSAQNRGSVSKK